MSKSGLNHTQDGQSDRIVEQRSGLAYNRTSMKNEKANQDANNNDKSELLKSSGSQSGFTKRMLNVSQGSKTSLNH